jgi:hypothetical protein
VGGGTSVVAVLSRLVASWGRPPNLLVLHAMWGHARATTRRWGGDPKSRLLTRVSGGAMGGDRRKKNTESITAPRCQDSQAEVCQTSELGTQH